jgi:tetratricopeptide (TPR) repeat protein
MAQLAPSCLNLGHVEALELLAQELIALGPHPEAGAAFVKSCVRTGQALDFGDRRANAEALFAIAQSAAEQTVEIDAHAMAWIHHMQAHRASFAGEPERALHHLDSAIHAFEQAGNLRFACSTRVDLGFELLEVGAFDRSIEVLREAAQTAHRLEMHPVEAVAKHNLGVALARIGDASATRCAVEEVLHGSLVHDDRKLEANSYTYLAVVNVLTGSYGASEQAARAALDISAIRPPIQAYACGVLATALQRQGRASESLEPATCAIDLLAALDGM